MSGITQDQAQAKLDALMAASNSGAMSVRYGDRQVVNFASRKEMLDEINYWSRIVSGFQRVAQGESRHGFALASFR